MAKQVDLINALNEQRNIVDQIGRETDQLLQKVQDLEKAVADQENASPELVAAVEAISTGLKAVNDKVPDVANKPKPAPDAETQPTYPGEFESDIRDIPAEPEEPAPQPVERGSNTAALKSKGLSNKPSNA